MSGRAISTPPPGSAEFPQVFSVVMESPTPDLSCYSLPMRIILAIAVVAVGAFLAGRWTAPPKAVVNYELPYSVAIQVLRHVPGVADDTGHIEDEWLSLVGYNPRVYGNAFDPKMSIRIPKDSELRAIVLH